MDLQSDIDRRVEAALETAERQCDEVRCQAQEQREILRDFRQQLMRSRTACG